MNTQTPFPRTHLSLYVSDINATVDFYREFFGVEPEKVKDDYAKFLVPEPAMIISFVANPERVAPNFGHLGIQVETPTQMHEKLDRLREKNMVAKEEIGTACCYALQDKFWVNDPDGHQWEVYYFHSDVEFNDPRFESSDAQACCTPEVKAKTRSGELKGEEACCEPASACC